MENKEDDIEDLFRERFENEEVDISPRVWQNIKKTLPEENQPFFFWFSSNIVLWSILSILSLSAGIGALIVFHQRTAFVPQAMTSSSIMTYSEKTSSYNSRSTAENSGHLSSEKDSMNFSKNSRKINPDHTKSPSKKTSLIPDTVLLPSGRNKSYSLNKKTSTNYSASYGIKHTGSIKKKKSNNHKYGADKSTDDRYKANKKYSTDSTFSSFTRPSDRDKGNKQLANDHYRSSLNKNNPSDKTSATFDVSSDSMDPAKKKGNEILTDASDSSLKNQNALINSNPLLSDKTISNKEFLQINPDSSFNLSSKKSTTEKDHSNLPKDSLSDTLHSTIDDQHSDDSLSTFANQLVALNDSIMATDSLQLPIEDSIYVANAGEKDKSQSDRMHCFSIDLITTSLLTGASTKGLDSLHQSAVEEKNKHDKNSWGYNTGIMINYKISDKLQVSSGIFYTTFSEQYSFNYNLKKTNWVFMDSTWQSVQVDSINRDIKVRDQYNFISVPLQLSYTFLVKEKFKLSAAAGIRSNILVQGVTYLPNAQKSDVIAVKSGFNSISFSYLISLEAEYKLGTYTSLILQPTFLYAASSIHNKASGLNQKPYGAGLTLGLRFTF